MSRIVRAGPVIAALIVSLSLVPAAAAQALPITEREKVRLHFEAPVSCAEREQFLAHIRARLGTDWEAFPGELARTIHVKVTLADHRYVARMELQDARGQQVARAVSGSRCEQVIEGIALVTVLAIQAQLKQPDESELPAAATKPPGDATLPATKTPGGREPVKALAREPSPPDPTELKFRIGGRGLVQQGVGPELALGYGGFAGLAWPHWALQLSVDATTTGWVVADVVPARFDLLAARLETCGRFELLVPVVSVEAGIFFQAGVLEAQGVSNPPTVTRGSGGTTKWLAPGLLLALRAELAQIFLGVEATVGFPLDQEQFYLAEGNLEKNIVYMVPWLSSSAALSAGVIF